MSLTRILLEDYKETRGTTELSSSAWKETYQKAYGLITGNQESELIAALTKILKEHRGRESINHGIISLTMVRSCKTILEFRQKHHDQIEKVLRDPIPGETDESKQLAKRLQVRKELDEQRVEAETVLKNITKQIYFTDEEKEEIKKQLTETDSKQTVVSYEMYERAGSLKKLKQHIEKQLGIKIQEPQIHRLQYPNMYRREENYCGKTIWFNIQILPVILIRAAA